MKRVLTPITALLALLAMADLLSSASLAAAAAPVQIEAARAGPEAVTEVAFDGSSTGSHRGRRNQTAAVPKPVTPAVPDLHGATRETADKAYRQKYGF